MKNKLITFYLTSIVMFALSGIFLLDKLDKSSKNQTDKIQYLDFNNSPVYIYPTIKLKKN